MALGFTSNDKGQREVLGSVIDKHKFHKQIVEFSMINSGSNFTKKFQQISESAGGSQFESRNYEREFALILQKMVDRGDITDWHHVPANSYLDHTLVDFIIVLKNGSLMPAQVTSKRKNLNKKYGRMKSLFSFQDGDRLPIALFHLRIHDSDANKDEDTILSEIRQAFHTTETIDVVKTS